uniref:Lipocln_cytosolic_FA-bd_dom domain-containing protein n=1 Tax=Parastrongyloides trichosuri TaxID=131310 RepID=A0A0N4ZRV7_PARTI
MVEIFEGTWHDPEYDNFENFLKEIGIGMIQRKFAKNLKDKVTFIVDGDKITMNTENTFVKSSLSFILNEEFYQKTPDGREYNSTFTFNDGKLFQVEKAINNKDVPSTCTRYIESGNLKVILNCRGVIATVVYKKLKN